MKPLTTSTPHVIIMVGVPGAGKTAFAEHFAKTFHAPYVKAEDLEQTAGIDKKAANVVAAKMLAELLKTQQTIVFDGDTASRATRASLVRTISQAGYKPLLVWVQTETMEAKRRSTLKHRGQPAQIAEQFGHALKRFVPPSPIEKPVVISGKHTYATQLKVILKRLAAEPRPANNDSISRTIVNERNILIR